MLHRSLCLFILYSLLSYVLAAVDDDGYTLNIYTDYMDIEILKGNQPALGRRFHFNSVFPTAAFFTGQQVNVAIGAVSSAAYLTFPKTLNLALIGEAVLKLAKTLNGFSFQLVNFNRKLPFHIGSTTFSSVENGILFWHFYFNAEFINSFRDVDESLVFQSSLLEPYPEAAEYDPNAYFTDNNRHVFYLKQREDLKYSNLLFLRPPDAPKVRIASAESDAVSYPYDKRSTFEISLPEPVKQSLSSDQKNNTTLVFIGLSAAALLALLCTFLLIRSNAKPKPTHKRRTKKPQIPKKHPHKSEAPQSAPKQHA